MDVTEEEANKYLKEDNDVVIKVSFQLKVGHLIDSKIMQLLPISFGKELVDSLLNASEEEQVIDEGKEPVKENENHSQSYSSVGTVEQPTEPRKMGTNSNSKAEVQSASFSDFEDLPLPKEERRNLDLLLDIPLQVTVELGRTKRNVKEILELTSGSILELDKLAGEPVDILVNHKLIAQGEVVVIDENFGVRVTDIVSKEARIKQLK